MTDALQEPTERVGLGFMILYGLASASVFLAVMPVLGILIPAQVTQIDVANSANNLAVVLVMGAIGAFIGNPLGGAISDRTVSRFGRRRPWIFGGTLITAAGLAMLAYSQSVFFLAVGWFIVQFFGNVLFAAYGAILPDRIPVNQRGTAQAIGGLTSPVIMIVGTYYLGRVQDFRAGYFPVIGVLILLNAIFLVFYREAALSKDLVAAFEWKTFLTSFWINPRKQPVFGRAWLAWLFIWTGYALGSGGFLFLYVQNITGYENLFAGQAVKEGISNIQVLQTLWGVPVMMLVAVLSDRLLRRKIFVLFGIGLVVLGMIALTLNSTWIWVLIACVISGVGFRIFFGLGAALISQILPSASNRGKDLGVMNIASTIPQIVMPGIGAMVINHWGLASPSGYQILFGSGAVLLILGGALVQSLRSVR